MAIVESVATVIVRTHCGSADEAARIARGAVEAGLAACGNIHGPVTSVYRWQGAVVEAPEWVLELKTVNSRTAALEALIRERHGYELPAILVLPVHGGESRYLDWIATEAAGEPVRPGSPGAS
jgi:periplasmic divalent cation tolerance protein